jgi:heterodisulfide reductase subunit A-like polyferredoxin
MRLEALRPLPPPPQTRSAFVDVGPAGLTVANKLQAKGLETVIFEKNSRVSGKCQAYYDELQMAQFKVRCCGCCKSNYYFNALDLPSMPFRNGYLVG